MQRPGDIILPRLFPPTVSIGGDQERTIKYQIKSPVVLDVSRWQGNINWPNISPPPVLVLCKASEGLDWTDPSFARNWTSLKNLNIRRGAYHYFRPGADPIGQFENYLKVVNAAGGFTPFDLGPALDIEGLEGVAPGNRSGIAANLKQWLDRAQSATNKLPIIYTSKYQWDFIKDPRGHTPSWAGKYPLWMAWYPNQPDRFNGPAQSAIPTGWENWAVWQYANNGQIKGLRTEVDLNILSEWFARQLELPSTPADPVPPVPSDPGPVPSNPVQYVGRVVSPAGVNVRERPKVASKHIGTLATGTKVIGNKLKVISAREAWLEVRDPVRGWCAIVYDGITLISLNS